MLKKELFCLTCNCEFTTKDALSNHKCDPSVLNPERPTKPAFRVFVENITKAEKEDKRLSKKH